MANKSYTMEEIQFRIRLIKNLKIAIAEAEKIGRLLDNMHDMLEANRARNAA